MTDKHKKHANDKHDHEEIKDIKDVEEEIVVDQEKELVELQQKAGEYLDGWQRCQAEFDNYKKRQTELQKDMVKYVAQNIVMQIIPVLDNFHASTAHVPEEQQGSAWVTGIMHIQKQLESVLTENGVTEIAPNPGDTFDPVYHEAIEDVECTHCEGKKYENKIKRVVQKGYALGEKVIRAARVIVE